MKKLIIALLSLLILVQPVFSMSLANSYGTGNMVEEVEQERATIEDQW